MGNAQQAIGDSTGTNTTMSDLFDIFDTYVVELRGDGKSVNKLRKTFKPFASPETDTDVDLVCELTREQPDPEEVFGAPDEYYGREGDRFIVRKPEGYGFISIGSDWDHIAISPEIDHYLVAYLIEFEIRKRLASEGYALIHGSGVQIDDTALIFPSWRYTGKTNTMMTLLRSGAEYLSDDRLWVGTDRSVLGYPVPINMMPSNIETYPGLSSMTRKEKLRSEASDRIYDRIDADGSIFEKAIYFATKFYIDPDLGRELVSVDQLIPGSEYIEQTDLDNVVVLRTGLKTPNNQIDVEEIPGQEAIGDIRAINYYEWNRELKEYYTAYDALFPNGNRADQLDELVAQEERHLSDLFDDVGTYRALIPRERDWVTTGIADEIVEKFTGLPSPVEVET